jgi:16S rRNA (cytosine967-C5)-methyltransferase
VSAGAGVRVAVLQVLRRVRDGARFEPALDAAVGTLPPADRRLTHEIAAGVLRHRAELDRTLRPLVVAQWSRVVPDVQDLLRTGAYQLQHLDRVPAYAAISATVEAAKDTVGPRPAGLVNAVLRRLASAPTAAPAPAADLAERYSHPAWLVDRWREAFGTERTEALLRHNNTRPPLTVRPVGTSPEALRAAFEQAGIPVRAAPFPPALQLESSDVRSLPGYDEGRFIVQDAAQARLLEFAAIPADLSVWDACAAPGGKAAALSGDVRRLFASDARRDRVRYLRQTLARVAPRVPVFVGDARRPPLRRGTVGAVLVDAPCSATGTLARHPDARWRLEPSRIQGLAGRQQAILDAVAEVVAPGGLLVYLTCSLEPEENARQVDGFLDRHPGFCREGDDLSIFPPDAGTDGGYGARMRRLS